MPNTYFQFKQFRINQKQSGMKVTTDACLFGAWVAYEIKGKNEPSAILDIGSGTGLLSLMLAQETNESKIQAIEINEAAYLEADRNFNQSPWNDRLRSYHISLQQYRPDFKYDLIVCNPPFFEASKKGKNLNKNEALHSLHLPTKDLLQSVIRLLSKEGFFFLLYPELETKKFIEIAEKAGLFLSQLITVKNELAKPIFRKMTRFGFEKVKIKESEIIIRKKNGTYTDEFWELLKYYYLEYNNPHLI